MENFEKPVPVISVTDWIITFIIMAIPLVNIIMLFVWGFGDANPNKANWAKASLVMMLVMGAIYFFIAIIFGALFWSSRNGF